VTPSNDPAMTRTTTPPSSSVAAHPLRVNDATAGRHPVQLGRMDGLHRPEAVAVEPLAFEQTLDHKTGRCARKQWNSQNCTCRREDRAI